MSRDHAKSSPRGERDRARWHILFLRDTTSPAALRATLEELGAVPFDPRTGRRWRWTSPGGERIELRWVEVGATVSEMVLFAADAWTRPLRTKGWTSEHALHVERGRDGGPSGAPMELADRITTVHEGITDVDPPSCTTCTSPRGLETLCRRGAETCPHCGVVVGYASMTALARARRRGSRPPALDAAPRRLPFRSWSGPLRRLLAWFRRPAG